MSDVTMHDIIRLTAHECKLSPDELIGARMGPSGINKTFRTARRIAAWLAYIHTTTSRAAMARDLGTTTECIRQDLNMMGRDSVRKPLQKILTAIESAIDDVHDVRMSARLNGGESCQMGVAE